MPQGCLWFIRTSLAVFQGMGVACAPATRRQCRCDGAVSCCARKTHSLRKCMGFVQLVSDFQTQSKECRGPACECHGCDACGSSCERKHTPGNRGLCRECSRAHMGPCMCEGDEFEDHFCYLPGRPCGLDGNCPRFPPCGKWRCDVCTSRHSLVAEMFREAFRLGAEDYKMI